MKVNKHCLMLAFVTTVAGAMPSGVIASELVGLLQVLRDNGTITQAQYQRLRDEAKQGSDALKQASAEVKEQTPIAGKAKKVSSTKSKRDTKIGFEKTGGLTLKDSQRGIDLTLGGRLLVDAVSYNDDATSLGSGTELRAARLSLKGALGEFWKFKVQYDFAEDDLSVKDAYLSYSGFEYLDSFTVGHFKQPFSLEDQTSGKQITFMERALPVDAFSPGRAIGLGLDQNGKSWSLSGGLFAEAVGDTPANEGNEGWGAAARGTFALYRGDSRNLHLGAAGGYREPDSRGRMRYRVGPESHLTSVSLVDTGNINSVDYSRVLGLEAAVVEGPFSLQGEYMRTHVERDAGNPGLDFDGWYLSGSWLLTGESRPYSASDGSFDPLIPKGEWGAWELGLRYSTLDLNDQGVMGGEVNSTSLGLNWYVNPRIRFMANYIRTESERGGVNDNPDIFQVRSQLVF